LGIERVDLLSSTRARVAPVLSIVARTRSVETVTRWLGVGAEAGAAATGAPSEGVVGAAAPEAAAGTGVGAGVAMPRRAAHARWPEHRRYSLWRFHDL
jgi:hypothetical protein